nr:alpha/beta hydrolase [Phaeacidiphilus oryzae]
MDSGDPDGRPVVLLHGTPGSRLGPFPNEAMLYRNSIRLITYDRPGYGGSDRMVKRQVGDAAADVERIADALGLERFGVAGRSGGGPHALACAAALPGRVTRCASLVSLAPYRAEGLDWTAGMVESNRRAYAEAAEYGLSEVEASLCQKRSAIAGEDRSGGATAVAERPSAQAAAAAAERPTTAERPAEQPQAAERSTVDGGRMLRRMDSEWHSTDRAVAMNPELSRQLQATFQEALRTDTAGWADDVMSFVSDWGFDPAEIDTDRVDVLLYHGSEDIYSPASHSRWLSSRIRGSRLWIEPGVSHFDNLRRLPELLVWVANGDA